ncbi:MAG: hypothetical protein N3B18_00740 [Desulfobacterota bacterium]|nr:hypothetical protein [Thermodesulfobacteriota bacterium]
MKCTVDNTSYVVVVPVSSQNDEGIASAWGTYHFVKHCLMESYHGLYQICSISENIMTEYRAVLHRGFNCPLFLRNPFDASQRFCTDCPSIQQCWKHLSMGIASYTKILMDVVCADSNKPRHIYYDTAKEKGNIAFVNDNGVVVITQRQRFRLVIKTGYRHSGLALTARRRMPDQHYLIEAKRKFKEGVIRGTYLNARFVNHTNWK